MKLLYIILAVISPFVSSLKSRMTLEEKIGQLNLPVVPSEIVTGEKMSENVLSRIRSGQAGAVFNAVGHDNVLALQKAAVEESRLGIPLLFGLDVIHGYKTIFPVPIALAASWDMALIEEVSRISAIEASADGINWLFGPMIDISRDPRWGRCVESPGEDPYLNGQYAAAVIRGFQGRLSDDSEVAACAKHFAIYGASESGRDYCETDMSPERMYNVYLEPYRMAVEAGALTVMSSFNDINGIPATANRWLLNDVLRDQWGFEGFIVSDYNAVSELSEHGLGDNRDVAAAALKAGTDMDMVSGLFLTCLSDAVRDGLVSEEAVDAACGRILEIKYRLGLFEDPYKYIRPGNSGRIGMPEYSDLARRAASSSFVLLKNDGALPLARNGKVALVGPFADAGSQYPGSWEARSKQDYPSLKDAFTARGDISFRYARGSNILDDEQMERLVTFRRPYKRDSRSSDAMLKEALRIARSSDVIVACLGEGAYMTGESNCRTTLDLPECQKRLLEKLVETGKPVVLVLFNGRPMTLCWEDEHASAILEVWYGGCEAGAAIADVLTGDVNPSGKLTMTFPRNVGQIPLYYGHKPLGRPNKEEDGFHRFRSSWIDSPNAPLYPFGYGLSYTTFEYSPVILSSPSMSAEDGCVNVSVTVRNTGTYDGEEIVQLYVHDKVSSMTRPVKELKSFRKVFIPAGGSVTVSFDITPDMLSWFYVDQYNMNGNFSSLRAQKTLEKGFFEIMVGASSLDTVSAELCVY